MKRYIIVTMLIAIVGMALLAYHSARFAMEQAQERSRVNGTISLQQIMR